MSSPIEFISEPYQESTIRFRDVDTDQFFVNCNGYLCQKRSADSFAMISDPEGVPSCTFVHGIEENEGIERLLPYIDKIKF